MTQPIDQVIDPEIKKALAQTKRPIQRLGQGIIGSKFYYGTSLPFKGREISAVVTSDRKIYLGYNRYTFKCKSCGCEEQTYQFNLPRITYPRKCNCQYKKDQEWEATEIYNPIIHDLGLDYRTPFNDDAIDYPWNTEAINKYYKGKHKKESIKKIFQEIVEINQKYIDHLNPTTHKFVAAWIIGDYCYMLFEQYGRLYFKGEKGSGKTKQCRLIKLTAFNSMWITKGTESSIFRDAEATCGTFVIDNMDKLHEDLKRAIEHHIETGWMHDATYRLTNKETGTTQKFLAYTPETVNNILGLDENTVDKTFEVPMLKSVNPEIKKTKLTTKSEKWEELRDRIRYWMLDNHKTVTDTYEKITADFSGREFDVVEGVLTIAKLVGDDVYEEISQYVKEKIEENWVNLENNPSYLIFTKIWEIFKQKPISQEERIFTSDLAESLFDKWYPTLEVGTAEYDNKKKSFAKYLATIIRSVPMFRKGGMSNGRTYIIIQRKDLLQYLRLQKFIKDEEALHSSTTSTTSTKSTTSTHKKKKLPKKDKKVEQVDHVEQVEEESQVDVKEKKWKDLQHGQRGECSECRKLEVLWWEKEGKLFCVPCHKKLILEGGIVQ